MNDFDLRAPLFEALKLDLAPFKGGWREDAFKATAANRPSNDLTRILGLSIKSEASEKKQWERVLPTLQHLKYLYVNRVNQRFFDLICELKNLERLDIEQSTVSDGSKVSNLTSLTHLNFGSSSKLESIEPLSELTNLTSLGLRGKFLKIEDLEPISRLYGLVGLNLCGQDYYTQTYLSLAPLSSLKNLKYLSLTAVKTKRDGLLPIAALKNLTYLILGMRNLKQWSLGDYKAIYEGCPKIKGDLIRLAATDQKFQKEHKIQQSG